MAKWLTEKELKQIARDFTPKTTPHSVVGVTVTTKRLVRDDSSGKYVVAPDTAAPKK